MRKLKVFGLLSWSLTLVGGAQAAELDYGYGFEVAPAAQEQAPDTETCSPVGNVVYRKAGVEQETNEPLVGRLEALSSVERNAYKLSVVTASGEKIVYPFANAYWAKIALKQLCTDATSYLDVSGCGFDTEDLIFVDYACHSVAARRNAYAHASPGIQWIGSRLDENLESVRIDSLRYSCPRSRIFFERYKENGQDLILQRLPADVGQTYRTFARGDAKRRAIARLHTEGVESRGLVSVHKSYCSKYSWETPYDPR